MAVSSAYVTCAEILLNEDSVNHNPDHSQQATVLSSLWNVLLLKLLLLRKWSQGFGGGGPKMTESPNIGMVLSKDSEGIRQSRPKILGFDLKKICKVGGFMKENWKNFDCICYEA